MESGSGWTAVIIEDDPDVRDLIDTVLTQSGFSTVTAEDGASGVEAVQQHNPLITTLDVNMPGMDGFAVAKRLREFSSTYLIMITALADEIDVVQGFEAGADDYLVKPFRPRELRARADSMLRRPRNRADVVGPDAVETPAAPAAPEPAPEPAPDTSWAREATRQLRGVPAAGGGAGQQPPAAHHQPAQQPAQQPQEPARLHAVPPPQEQQYQQPPQYQQPSEPQQAPQYQPPLQPVPPTPTGPSGPTAEGGWVRFNGLVLNTETRLVSVNGGAVDLTRTEFDLLASLLSTGRRVRSKADLVLTMRGQQYVTSYFVNEADKRSVEVHIANLRRKIGDDSASPTFIETVRGVGYRLAESRG